jgi:hypothetical protein
MANGFLKGTVFVAGTATPMYYCTDVQTGPLVKVTCRESNLPYQMNCVNGQYAFYLPAGTYDMRVTCSGYNNKAKNGIIIYADRTKTVNIYM